MNQDLHRATHIAADIYARRRGVGATLASAAFRDGAEWERQRAAAEVPERITAGGAKAGAGGRTVTRSSIAYAVLWAILIPLVWTGSGPGLQWDPVWYQYPAWHRAIDTAVASAGGAVLAYIAWGLIGESWKYIASGPPVRLPTVHEALLIGLAILVTLLVMALVMALWWAFLLGLEAAGSWLFGPLVLLGALLGPALILALGMLLIVARAILLYTVPLLWRAVRSLGSLHLRAIQRGRSSP